MNRNIKNMIEYAKETKNPDSKYLFQALQELQVRANESFARKLIERKEKENK